MSKYLSGKYYQENEERLPKKPCERCQNLSKEEKKIWFWIRQKSLRKWKAKAYREKLL